MREHWKKRHPWGSGTWQGICQRLGFWSVKQKMSPHWTPHRHANKCLIICNSQKSETCWDGVERKPLNLRTKIQKIPGKAAPTQNTKYPIDNLTSVTHRVTTKTAKVKLSPVSNQISSNWCPKDPVKGKVFPSLGLTSVYLSLSCVTQCNRLSGERKAYKKRKRYTPERQRIIRARFINDRDNVETS